ncbi:MAG: 50S ribosomal protein L3 [Candidatus Marinimicrobia bacterium]|nr:50S ribosomal protein L3 [Candidatus Neomarinimicrobiota bacterium]MCF7827472.1 50S ribosomal protein L3 [Candidatus Neomarinimicrobiota bacterium]MCF7882398.1 50S ribosomal protein L3 [Candidatus Neomarinimicrobiota bacterium]
MNGLIGKKKGMTRVFNDNGEDIPVTVIEAGPCYVTQVKTEETDGYNAVQIGFEPKKKKRANKPESGHTAKAEVDAMKVLREFDAGDEQYEPGAEITVDIFNAGEKVDVTGTSKGRGFTGVVKKYGFAGGPKTRGQSDTWRRPGSIGASADPSRVFPGMRMSGQAGNEQVTEKALTVVATDAEKNLLLVKGSVPGSNNGYLIIRKA